MRLFDQKFELVATASAIQETGGGIDEKIYELYDLTDEEITTIEKTQ